MSRDPWAEERKKYEEEDEEEGAAADEEDHERGGESEEKDCSLVGCISLWPASSVIGRHSIAAH